MSGGSKSQETKVQMPGFMSQAARPLAAGIGTLTPYEGPLAPGMSGYTQAGMEGLGAPGGYDEAIDYYQRAAQGDFLGLSPDFARAVMNPAIENVASRFAMAGRSGSPASVQGMTEAAMRSLAPYYSDERRMQQQAAAALPMAYQDLYKSQLAAGDISDVYGQREIEEGRYDPTYDLLQRQIGLLQGVPFAGGTTVAQQPGGSPVAGALGGAAIGSQWGPWGALAGGGLGLLGSVF